MRTLRKRRNASPAESPIAPVSVHDANLVAGHVGCDPRTVRRFFDGRPMRESTRRSIARALAELDLGRGEQQQGDPAELLLRAAGGDRG